MIFYVSFAIARTVHRLLLRYAPTSRIAAFVRTRRGHKWGVPIAALLVPAYTAMMLKCAEWFEATGSGWIALVGGLMFWNAAKFTALALVSVGLLLRARSRELPPRGGRRHAQQLSVTTDSEPARDRKSVAAWIDGRGRRPARVRAGRQGPDQVGPADRGLLRGRPARLSGCRAGLAQGARRASELHTIGRSLL